MLSVENQIEVKNFFVAVHQVTCIWKMMCVMHYLHYDINSPPPPIKFASSLLYT